MLRNINFKQCIFVNPFDSNKCIFVIIITNFKFSLKRQYVLGLSLLYTMTCDQSSSHVTWISLGHGLQTTVHDHDIL